MYWLLSIYIAVSLLAVLHIILYGTRPARSLSWIFILILLPFVGVLLYGVFGLNRRRFKFYRLKETSRRRLYDLKAARDHVVELPSDVNSKKVEKLSKLMESSSVFPAYSGNEVTVLQEGKKTFETIFEAISQAKDFIHLQYYIFSEGELMDQLYEIFRKKIKEGVEIRILYDAIGSYSLSAKAVKRFKNLGVQIHQTMPLRYGSFLFTLNYRNHRKIIIVDGNIGFTGGMNVSDKYIKSKDSMGVWDDTHVKIEGPAVDSLHRIFIKDYFFASDKESLVKAKYLPKLQKKGTTIAQLVSGGPDSNHPSILHQYIAMINLAEESIYICNPYFIPNSALLEALRMAALIDVTIKLLIPLQSDSWLAKHCMLSYFEELLFLGVEIYVQRENFLHSKVIVIDEEIASIGSGNFDHRSFEYNFETNALIYDTKIAQGIGKDFLDDCAESKQLKYDDYKNRPMKRKLAEGVARFFSPLL